jgi:anaerobic selenocysteine-containing dehydrogenase
MCHESTSVALAESIGIGKASVTLSDVHNAELIILAGQNPGTNHPRMLSAPVLVRTRLAPQPRRTHPAHRTPGAILRMGAES